jgi:hypothetical protein
MTVRTCKARKLIPIKLTPEELEQKATEATRLMTELDSEEEKYKLIKREWNQKLKEIKLSLRTLCGVYAAKEEEREVDTERHYDLESRDVWDVYEGKEYGRRKMDELEYRKAKQGTLFGDGPDLPGVQHDAGQPYDRKEEDSHQSAENG